MRPALEVTHRCVHPDAMAGWRKRVLSETPVLALVMVVVDSRKCTNNTLVIAHKIKQVPLHGDMTTVAASLPVRKDLHETLVPVTPVTGKNRVIDRVNTLYTTASLHDTFHDGNSVQFNCRVECPADATGPMTVTTNDFVQQPWSDGTVLPVSMDEDRLITIVRPGGYLDVVAWAVLAPLSTPFTMHLPQFKPAHVHFRPHGTVKVVPLKGGGEYSTYAVDDSATYSVLVEPYSSWTAEELLEMWPLPTEAGLDPDGSLYTAPMNRGTQVPTLFGGSEPAVTPSH